MITLSGALGVIVTELQAEGIELPSIIVTISVVLALVASYLKEETRPPSSAVDAVEADLLAAIRAKSARDQARR